MVVERIKNVVGRSAGRAGDGQIARCRTRCEDQDAMSTDLTLILEHRPGELARLGRLSAKPVSVSVGLRPSPVRAGVSSTCSWTTTPWPGARAALERAGIGIAGGREVLVVDIEDRPMTVGELTRQLADANVNVDLAYTTFGGMKVVIATDDLESARAALL